MCDVTILFCRIAIIVYHVTDKNFVLFPQLSASYETRTAQQLVLIILKSVPQLLTPKHSAFRWTLTNVCASKWLMFLTVFARCTVIQLYNTNKMIQYLTFWDTVLHFLNNLQFYILRYIFLCLKNSYCRFNCNILQYM